MSKQLLVIINPRGGGGRAKRLLRDARLEDLGFGLRIRTTEYPGHAAQITRNESLSSQDQVLVVGGDGTLHEVINALMERDQRERPTLGVLPGGTGNSLAHDLGITVLTKARAVLQNPRKRSMDVLRVSAQGRRFYSFNMVGWGLPATAGRLAESLRWLGPGRYTAASVIDIVRGGFPSVSLEAGGERYQGCYPAVIICNTQHIGTGMKMAPRAELDDGLMDVVVLEPTSRYRMLQLLRRVYDGSHVDSEGLHYHQVERFSLCAPELSPLNVDGEILASQAFEIEMVPGALEVMG